MHIIIDSEEDEGEEAMRFIREQYEDAIVEAGGGLA